MLSFDIKCIIDASFKPPFAFHDTGNTGEGHMVKNTLEIKQVKVVRYRQPCC
jgi:hypothetical protein